MQGSELKAIRKGLGLSQSEMAGHLGLTSTFIGLMERDERPIETRTALAARQFFNENSRLSSAHRVTALAVDVPLSEAVVLWEPDEEGIPSVTVVGREADDPRYSSSFGADSEDWQQSDDVGRLLRLLAKFVELTVQERLKPKAVHDALSVIPEYRSALHFTMFKAGVTVD